MESEPAPVPCLRGRETWSGKRGPVAAQAGGADARIRRKGRKLLSEEYLAARAISLRIASEVDPPRFYLEKEEAVEASRAALEGHPLCMSVRELVEERGERLGHGMAHVLKVAVDAGALVLIESEVGGEGEREDRERTLLLVHLAGLLHDIRRDEPEHALKGAEEAEMILRGFDVRDGERKAITQAIRNHEAFKPAMPLEDPSLQVLSDALYDADKFRWGPDNFTETLWSMAAPFRIPLEVLLRNFLPRMEGIRRIADTFRTPTGREYGPDFIARGLEIGERLYRELAGMYGI